MLLFTDSLFSPHRKMAHGLPRAPAWAGGPKTDGQAAQAARAPVPPGPKLGPAAAGGRGHPQPSDAFDLDPTATRCFRWYKKGMCGRRPLKTLELSCSLSRSAPTTMAAAVRWPATSLCRRRRRSAARPKAADDPLSSLYSLPPPVP
jgi:hypothetical protein